MQIRRPKAVFTDARGRIVDILDGIPVECVTMLSSKRGAVRGNHYHKKTTQYTYVLAGALRYFTQQPGERIRSRLMRQGDLAISPPRERHAFVALEDSMLLACAHGPRAGKNYEGDTYRLDEPISGSTAKRRSARR